MSAKRRAALRVVMACMAMTVSTALVSVATADSAHAAITGCKNGGAYVLWARGSSQALGAVEANAFGVSVSVALDAAGIAPYASVELGNLDGSQGPGEDPDQQDEYPAAAVPWAVLTSQYDASVFTGVTELITHLNYRYTPGPVGMGCMSETAILGGYSQGADLIGWALALTEPGTFGLPALTPEARNHIGYVALYGDPKYNGACGQNRPWVQGNARCNSEPRLGVRSPYLPSDFLYRTGSWCDDGDGICAVNFWTFGIGNHTSAYRNQWIWQSAPVIAAAARAKQCSLVTACSGGGTSPSSGNPYGTLDDAGPIGSGDKFFVRGWAIDPNAGTGPVAVHTYVDGVLAGAVTASGYRPDVGAAFPGAGNNHGYYAEYPVGVGTHQICTYAINHGAGDANPQLPACKTVKRAGVGDYDTNGTTDLSLFRPSAASWYIRNAASFAYGQAGDIPVPGDYDGNGAIEGAVYRPGNPANWHVRGLNSVAFGQPGDIPVPARWNGDNIADIAVFRPGDGTWHIRGIGDFAYGQAGDIPVPGDYDGNGTIEAAVFRPSTGWWYIRGGAAVQYGNPGDIPVPGRWNSDASTDVAIFRPSTGEWAIRSIGGFTYGQSGDVPILGDFDGNGVNEAGVFRPSSGYWHVRGGSSTAYGQAGDIPAPYAFNLKILQQLGLI